MIETLLLEISTFGGLGSLVNYPGVFAAVMGTTWFLYLKKYQKNKIWFIAVAQMVLAVFVTGVAEQALGVKDSGTIILDEFVAVPFMFLWWEYVAAKYQKPLLGLSLVIFGILDISKALGISLAEQLSGGIGIVADDLVAALYTSLMVMIVYILYSKSLTFLNFRVN